MGYMEDKIFEIFIRTKLLFFCLPLNLYLNMKWQNFWCAIQEKSVQCTFVPPSLHKYVKKCGFTYKIFQIAAFPECWFVFGVQTYVNELKVYNSESYRKIELCVFSKIRLFWLNLSMWRFSRFVASFLPLTIFTYTVVKKITRSTCSENLSNLSQLVCQTVIFLWMLLTCSLL